MTQNLAVLAITEDDVCKILSTKAHLCEANANFQMKGYAYSKVEKTSNARAYHVLDIGCMWEKLVLAARAIAAIENPFDVVVASAWKHGQRAVLKFAQYTGATAFVGRFTPGKFTNQGQSGFHEPRLLVVSDPFTDHQPIRESSFVNLPVIAMANTESPLRFVDIAIPCNNKGNDSLGLMWWFLTREVLRLRGSISREVEWDVMPDLFIYKEPEPETEEGPADPSLPKFEDIRPDAAATTSAGVGTTDDWGGGAVATNTEEWMTTTADWGGVSDWSATPAPKATDDWNTAPVPKEDWSATPMPKTDDWGATPMPKTDDWSAAPMPKTDDWSAAPVQDNWDMAATTDSWGAQGGADASGWDAH